MSGGSKCLTHTLTHTHTHFQVQGLEKGVSENEAPGPVGAYTTTHNDTITLMHTHTHFRVAIKKTRKTPKKRMVGPREDKHANELFKMRKKKRRPSRRSRGPLQSAAPATQRSWLSKEAV